MPDRLAIFIDGANLHATTRALHVDLDFSKLRERFAAQGRLVRALYYTAVVEGEEFSPVKPLIDWLDYNGFSVVTKPARRFIDADGRSRIKGNMDMEMAVDLLDLAPRLDHVVLFTGDGDFRRVVEAVQAKGVRVTVVSTLKSQPPQIADELRRQADVFIDLADLLPDVARRAAGSVALPPRESGALGCSLPVVQPGSSASRFRAWRRLAMRRSNGVFTPSERRGAMWVVVGCVIVASLGAAADRFISPSLGWYAQTGVGQTLDGVIEAQPLG